MMRVNLEMCNFCLTEAWNLDIPNSRKGNSQIVEECFGSHSMMMLCAMQRTFA